MLDLGGIPAVLEIRNGGYLELRDMLLKNIATEQDLRNLNFTSYIRPNFTRVSGMLSWPSFYAEAGSSYGVYNTTQYFWSNTIFYRGTVTGRTLPRRPTVRRWLPAQPD